MIAVALAALLPAHKFLPCATTIPHGRDYSMGSLADASQSGKANKAGFEL